MLQIIGKGGLAREVMAYYKKKYGKEIIRCFEYDCKGINFISPSIIAIGDGSIRKGFDDKIDARWTSLNFGSLYDSSIEYGIGAVICPGSVLTTHIKIGVHCFINLNCTIGHDCNLGDYVTLMPGVNISGNCFIGNLVTIGSNAVIRDGITICDNVYIGAGSVVVKDILESGVYIGTPAKLLKKI